MAQSKRQQGDLSGSVGIYMTGVLHTDHVARLLSGTGDLASVLRHRQEVSADNRPPTETRIESVQSGSIDVLIDAFSGQPIGEGLGLAALVTGSWRFYVKSRLDILKIRERKAEVIADEAEAELRKSKATASVEELAKQAATRMKDAQRVDEGIRRRAAVSAAAEALTQSSAEGVLDEKAMSAAIHHLAESLLAADAHIQSDPNNDVKVADGRNAKQARAVSLRSDLEAATADLTQ